MPPNIDIQFAIQDANIPSPEDFKTWAKAVYNKSADICIRVVDTKEMTALNKKYRHKAGPTNVLSFLYDDEILSGDIVICAEQVAQETQQQHKGIKAHWAHIVVHGMLHILGETHDTPEKASKMEAKEAAILQKLGYPNPYLDG